MANKTMAARRNDRIMITLKMLPLLSNLTQQSNMMVKYNGPARIIARRANDCAVFMAAVLKS